MKCGTVVVKSWTVVKCRTAVGKCGTTVVKCGTAVGKRGNAAVKCTAERNVKQ